MRIPNSLLRTTCQRGFTLVELMVSLTIGMVIVLFVSAMYVSSRGTQRITDDNMRIQEETQIIMNLLGRNLMQAGFGNLTAYKKVDLTGKGLLSCDQGFSDPKSTLIDPACATSTGYAGFQVRYRVEDAYSSNTGAGADCNGQNVDASSTSKGIVTNRFYLSTKSGETTRSLYCNGSGNFTNPQPLLGNVEDMRLTYGVDTDGDQSADTFPSSADAVSALDPTWKSVVSVNVCLQVAGDNNVTPVMQKYVDCSGTEQTATDRKIRTVLTRLFTLRNNAASKNQI